MRKGNLIFDANFESGNMGTVEMVREGEYNISIRPDTSNARYRVWFYFSVRNAVAGQCVIFTITNFSKTKSLYREGMTPVVRSTSRPKWQRMPAKAVYYYKSPKNPAMYTLSFVFLFDNDQDTYYFAYCFPYTYTTLQQYLFQLEQRKMSYFSRMTLCRTVQHRRLDCLTITSPNTDGRRKRLVVITARVHPGETPASFVCQGLIDFLVSDDAVAKALRSRVIFKVIPMLNPDGVFEGNYRAHFLGDDLNRHWLKPSAWCHPTVVAVKKLLGQGLGQRPCDASGGQTNLDFLSIFTRTRH